MLRAKTFGVLLCPQPHCHLSDSFAVLIHVFASVVWHSMIISLTGLLFFGLSDFGGDRPDRAASECFRNGHGWRNSKWSI